MINRAFALSLGLGLAACMTPDDVQLEEVAQPLRGCTGPFCGANSPIIKVYGTTGFNLDGQVNDEGFYYLGMSKNGTWFEMRVEDSRITGRNNAGVVVLQDEALVGAKIWVGIGGREQFAISIEAVGDFWEVVTPNAPLQTYHLKWDEAFANHLPPFQVVPANADRPTPSLYEKPIDVCPDVPIVSGPELEWDESAQMVIEVPYHSVVFEGDRFHAANRTMDKRFDPRWFNIGCARHTLAKMRLTRNVLAFNRWDQTQSVLKMLTADYCGVAAFTVPGHPLVWRDGGGLTSTGMWDYFKDPDNLEARWNPNGATCLENPRYYKRAQIELECRRFMPPPCKNTNPFQWDNELVTSGNTK